MDEAKLMDSVDGKYTFCDVEPSDILGECIIFNEHGHEVPTREELHDKIQRLWVLEGIKQLNNPSGVGLSQDIALSTDVGQLRRKFQSPASVTTNKCVPGPFSTSHPSSMSS